MVTIDRLAGHLINVFWVDTDLIDRVSEDHKMGPGFKTALKKDITYIVNPDQPQFRRQLGPQGFVEFARALVRDYDRVGCGRDVPLFDFHVTESPMNAFNQSPLETERDIRLWAGRPAIDQNGHTDWSHNEDIALLEAPNLSQPDSCRILSEMGLSAAYGREVSKVKDTRLYKWEQRTK